MFCSYRRVDKNYPPAERAWTPDIAHHKAPSRFGRASLLQYHAVRSLKTILPSKRWYSDVEVMQA